MRLPSSPGSELFETPRQCSRRHPPDSARELRKFYESKQYKPLDLRPQMTRARCCRLNKQGENLTTKKQQQKERLYPLRESAVKGGESASIKHKHTGKKHSNVTGKIVWITHLCPHLKNKKT